jgi:serpin B
VTEEGTEAAAATAVAMMAASVPSHIEQLAVDRPFLFYITDEPTGAILFQGRISDPRPQP